MSSNNNVEVKKGMWERYDEPRIAEMERVKKLKEWGADFARSEAYEHKRMIEKALRRGGIRKHGLNSE